MANKRITAGEDNRKQTMHENWQVMKPFVHFAFKAMVVVGGALISIVKLLPSLLEHKEENHNKNKKIIKI